MQARSSNPRDFLCDQKKKKPHTAQKIVSPVYCTYYCDTQAHTLHTQAHDDDDDDDVRPSAVEEDHDLT